MKQVSSATSLVVLLFAGIALVATGCQKEELRDTAPEQNLLNSSQKQDQQKRAVPFKADFELTSAVTHEDGATVIFTTGTGEGTHIGRSSYVCNARLDATGYNDILVLTAADGSEIHAVGNGPGPVIDFTTLDYIITYQSSITGGTGRFAGATGSLTIVGHGNLNSPAGTATLTGTISY